MNSLHYLSSIDLLYSGLDANYTPTEYFNSLSYPIEYVSASSYSVFLLESKSYNLINNFNYYYNKWWFFALEGPVSLIENYSYFSFLIILFYFQIAIAVATVT